MSDEQLLNRIRDLERLIYRLPEKNMGGWNPLFSPAYVSATSVVFTGIDLSSVFPFGTKIKLTQTTVKYFYVLSASYSGGNTTLTLTGGGSFTVANAAITEFFYNHLATSSIPIGITTFIPTGTLSSTNWDGDSWTTTGKTLINLASEFGLPANIKQVKCRLIAWGSTSSSSTSSYIGLSPNNTNVDFELNCWFAGNPNNMRTEVFGNVCCNSNGNIYWQGNSASAGTCVRYLTILGYWI